jgi:hypothetical protein
MIAVSIEIVHEMGGAAVATWKDVVVLATRTAITLESVRAYIDTINAAARVRPTSGLTVIGQRTALPDKDVLKSISTAASRCLATCMARAIPGQGLWVTALRGMASSVQVWATPGRPQETFQSIPDATAWMAKIMNKDQTWQGQLSTMAGTLLYGSPSFNRASQIAPYLALGDEDDDVAGGRRR